MVSIELHHTGVKMYFTIIHNHSWKRNAEKNYFQQD
jgi:hypothetical protein